MTTLAPEATTTGHDSGDDLTHAICGCNEDLALCGADVSGEPWAGEAEEVNCIVCQDLMWSPCERCGR
ncbi:hypothetical protein ACIOC2_19205 [Streptomyces sp. NPDC088337]|uniref:hypothetical protein n=1 Tax=unclassified Streptomyces TaxID=2593676 RepID=UPI00382944A3